MSTLLNVDLEQGGSIMIEVDEPDRGGPVMRGGGREAEAVVHAEETLEQLLGKLGPAVRGIVSQLRADIDGPQQIEVEFAIKISANANIVIARAGSEANFRIALRWLHSPPPG